MMHVELTPRLLLCAPVAADTGADTGAVDLSGRDLMHHACLMGDFDWVQWALQAGCEVPPKGVKDVVRALQTTKLGLQPVS
jgi:hypothetical protein